jgi:hypothetical protein
VDNTNAARRNENVGPRPIEQSQESLRELRMVGLWQRGVSGRGISRVQSERKDPVISSLHAPPCTREGTHHREAGIARAVGDERSHRARTASNVSAFETKCRRIVAFSYGVIASFVLHSMEGVGVTLQLRQDSCPWAPATPTQTPGAAQVRRRAAPARVSRGVSGHRCGRTPAPRWCRHVLDIGGRARGPVVDGGLS